MAYRPAPALPFDAAQATHLNGEAEKVARAFVDPADFIALKVLYAEPLKPRPGWIVYADGTSWNPAGGREGLYRYSLAGTWEPITP
jgi:hypothetical protein